MGFRQITRAICIAGVMLLAVNATALAADGGGNDAPQNAYQLNMKGSPLQATVVPDDNTGAGESDTFTEELTCGSTYHSTLWYVFYPHVTGEASVLVAPGADFPPAIKVYPFVPGATNTEAGTCGTTLVVQRAALLTLYVTPSRGYLVQVGSLTGYSQGSFTLGLTFDPDSDGDRVLDKNDDCRTQAGPAQHRGCPDSDGDGLRDRDDACPNQAGPSRLGGCPDSDNDGIVDKNDACPREDSRARDANKNGCLDFGVLAPKFRLKYRDAAGGIRVTSFSVEKLVKGARIQVRCKRPSCGQVSGRTRKTSYRLKRFHGLRMPAGMQVLVRITARGYVGKYYKVRITQAGYKTRELCIQPGSKAPRRRCNSVR